MSSGNRRLTTWLREAINLVLAGHTPTQPCPAGILMERGHFAQEDVWVWAEWRQWQTPTPVRLHRWEGISP